MQYSRRMGTPARLSVLNRLREAWRRAVVGPVLRQLTQGIDPRRLALTLALGSGLSLFPVFGATAPLCLAVGMVLRLNQPLIQAVNALCNAVWIPSLILFIRLGDLLARSSSGALDLPNLVALIGRDPLEFLRRWRTATLHAVLGWAAAVPFWSLLVYSASLPLLRAAHARRPLVGAVPASGPGSEAGVRVGGS